MAEAELNKIGVLDPCSEAVNDLLASVEQKGQAEIIRVKTAEEAQQLALHHQPCMLVITFQENGDVPPRVNMLKKLEKTIKSGMIKTLVVSKVKNKQLSSLVAAMGVTDFMEEPVPARTMHFKTNLQLKAVATIRKQQELKKKSEERIVFKKSEQKQEGDSPQGQEAKKAPPLAIKEDYFLFKNSGVKKAGKKVVVEMEGPDPSTGEWAPVAEEAGAKTAWKWQPKAAEDETQPPGDEGWVHEGDKPTFNEESGKWQFVSEKPELAYKKAGETLARKISTDESGEVVVAEDSLTAMENVRESRQKAETLKLEEKKRAAAGRPEAEEEKSEAHQPEYKALRQEKERTPGLNHKDLPELDESGMELVNKLGSGEEDSPAPLNDKTAEGAAEDYGTFNNRTGRSQEEKSEAQKPRGMSPLDFLQKKKELLQKSGESEPTAALEEESTDSSGPAAAEKRKETGAALQPLKKEKERKPSVNPALAALERLKKRAAEKLPEDEEERLQQAEAVEAPKEETAEVAAPSAASGRERKEKTGGRPPELLAEKKAPGQGRPRLPREEKKKRKKEILRSIQELLAEPLPEELSPEEEEELREELGLKDRPDVPPLELARKKRLKELKEMKEKVKELDDIPELEQEAEPVLKEHDLSPEEPENTWSQQLAGEDRRSSLQAHTEDEEQATLEEEGEHRLKALKREKRRGKPSFSPANAEPRNLSGDNGPEEDSESGGRAGRKTADEADLLEESKAERAAKDRVEEDLLPGRTGSRKEKTRERDAASLLEALEREEEEMLESSEGSPPEEEELEESEAGSGRDRKKSPRQAEEDALADGGEPVRKHSPSQRDAASLLKSLEEEDEELQSSLDPERKPKGSEESEEAEDDARESQERPASASDDLAIELRNRKDLPPIPAPGENLSEFLKKDSPALERFLERRKSKVREPKPEVPAADSSNPYLGVMVCISNAFGPLRDRNRAVTKILRAMEGAFGNCFAYVLADIDSNGIGTVQISTGQEHKEGEQVETATGLAFPLQQSENDSSEVRGILYLRPSGSRKSFSSEEESTARKASTSLWAILSPASEKEERAA